MLVLAVLAGLHVLLTWGLAYRRGRMMSAAEPLPKAERTPTSIIVPVWNDATVLSRTCSALSEELSGQEACEVIMIAGGEDNSFELAQDLARQLQIPATPWRVLQQSPAGKNAALNEALAVANGTIIIFLDADTSVQSGWLAALTAPIARGHVDATAGNFEPYKRTPVGQVYELDQLVSQVILGQVVLFGGGTIALRRSALQTIGGRLPEDVLVGVDWDLSARLQAAGAKLGFARGAKVKTEVPQTWREYFRAEVRWKRAFFWNELRHFKRDRAPKRLLGLVYTPVVQGILLTGWFALPLLGSLLGFGAWQGLLLYFIFTAWVLLRHAARCLSAAACGGATWLRLIPSYLLSFYLSSAASYRALATLNRLSAHFKGRRPVNV